ncbi:hypothetical protein [Aquariibacter albus]|uniref:Uncharacterized protein n=1 Tax=Aquariibacter albus TaxID=2759899 RepID=A0A839HGP7_9BURK|nr:hypothetical protein [Aquariibacter albus]MBB1161497.1 hypothetical protein [Aquariibacter albus]
MSVHLQCLTDEEPLRRAYQEQHELSSTALEIELRRRLEARIDSPDLPAGLAPLLDGYDFDKTKDLELIGAALAFAEKNDLDAAQRLLDACADADLYEPADLKRELDRLAELERQINDGELVAAIPTA